MIERGTVKKTARGIVYIELGKKVECEGCKLCAFGKSDSVIIPAACEKDVRAGQTVAVDIPDEPKGNAPLLIYAIPLLTMLAGALIGLVGQWWLQLTLSAVGLILGALILVPIDRAYRRRPGAVAKVTEIINETKKDDGYGT